MSPTQRTLQRLRKDGWTCAVVERWNPHAKIRQDLFGCVDILALKPGLPPLGIQATSDSNHATRRTKALREPRLLTWLATGARFHVWSWKKNGRGHWEVRVEELIGVQVINEQAEMEKEAAA